MIYLILSIFVVSYFECSCQECILSLYRDLPKKHEPLYFVQNGNTLDLFMPHMVGEDGVMVLQEGQQLVLACPGRNNKLTVSGAEATLSTCAGGIMLSIDNKIFPTYQLECENPVQALLQVTSEKCGCDKGTELRIGFHSSHWINLVTSCHIIKKSESLYSTHIIYGKTLAGAEVKWARPQFTRGNDQLYSGFNPDHFYKMKHQRHILLKLLGKKQTDIILQENFLSRGHLAPDADFLFGTWQYVTYFYANSAPQWLTINSGNWQHIERFIRHFAIMSRSDLLITTGTYGILQLADSSGNYKKLYLHPEERQLPVPKYFWKVVLDPEKKACIAFICANNPFMRRAPTKLCRNICSYSGWPSYAENYAKGYIYCCEYQDLRNKIPTIPPIDCVSLLVGPKAFYNYREFNHTAAAG